jgi:DNA-directed RNA polymerase subunit N (RpoN/RPB10)
MGNLHSRLRLALAAGYIVEEALLLLGVERVCCRTSLTQHVALAEQNLMFAILPGLPPSPPHLSPAAPKH